jgi:phospholipase/carboxylesterase
MHPYQILRHGKPLQEAEKALILLHGRGSTANNILPLAGEFSDERFHIAAPQAGNNTWYPYSFLMPEAQNEPWLSSAVATVKRLIDEIAEEIPAGSIYIMGFSQGACLALEVTSRYAARYAGVAAFTGGLIGEQVNPEKYGGDFAGTPVFIGTSDVDPHVPVHRSEESRDIMQGLGAEVTLKIYPRMPHTIVPDEIETVRQAMF